MSVIFNQTNINATEAFASGGGGGGSNFPSGIKIGTNTLMPNQTFSETQNCLSVSDLSGTPAQFIAYPIKSGDDVVGYTILNNNNITFQKANTGNSVPFTSFDGTTNIALSNINTLNTYWPSIVVNTDTPSPATGVITQFGRVSYDGPGTSIVEITPPYTQFMRVFLTPTTNDGVPDGIYSYNNQGGASLSSFTVNSTGTNSSVELSWMTIGW